MKNIAIIPRPSISRAQCGTYLQITVDKATYPSTLTCVDGRTAAEEFAMR
jgi:hypothetical protein